MRMVFSVGYLPVKHLIDINHVCSYVSCTVNHHSMYMEKNVLYCFHIFCSAELGIMDCHCNNDVITSEGKITE